jgi:hypothetical protein
MLKRVFILLLVIFPACNNAPAPEETNKITKGPAKPKTSPAKPAVNPWIINSYAPKEGETEGRKYVKFVTEGDFSDSTGNKRYLHAEVLVNKTNGGIFLHELKKTNPAEKFNEPVRIKMSNSSGEELLMTSSRRWNASGGILIEKNNNDYSQFRIFLLSSKGKITVEISDSGSRTYNFNINADGFSDSFTKLGS